MHTERGYILRTERVEDMHFRRRHEGGTHGNTRTWTYI